MVSTFQNLSSKRVYKDITVTQGLDVIQSGKFKSEVNKARQYERKSKEYIDIKSKIPCITWASLIEEERNLKNVKELSGFIYLDFDNQDVEVDEYTYAQWKSLSGQGCGKLIKVDNLTKENFKSTLEFLLDNYDTADKLSDMCRLNILSSDKDLYYNNNSQSIQAVNPRIVDYKPNLITIDVNSDKYVTEVCLMAYRHCLKTNKTFTDGCKHLSCVSYFAVTNQFGIALEEANYQLMKWFVHQNSIKIGKDIYKRYSHQFRNLLLNVK
jgi:hypothetical protein